MNTFMGQTVLNALHRNPCLICLLQQPCKGVTVTLVLEIGKQAQRDEVSFPKLHSLLLKQLDSSPGLSDPKLCFHLPKGSPHLGPIAVLMATIILQNLSKGFNSKIPRAVLTGKKLHRATQFYIIFKTNFRIRKVTYMQ